MTEHVRPGTLRTHAAPASSSFGWVGALGRTARIAAEPSRILPVAIDELAAAHGAAPALIGESATLSHAELSARQNRVARWALGAGLAKGDTVALLMRNAPDYLATWLGLTRVGVTVALLNTNLSGGALAHAVAAAAPRLLVAERCFAGVLGEGAAGGCETVWHDALMAASAALPGGPLPPGEAPAVALRDGALLIYTSGTTGLSKAARVSHHRLMTWTHWFAGLIDATPADRMYDCLPLYHSVGGVVAPFSTLIGGGSVVIREKFSAGRFWSDVAATRSTLFQYIGELCRYLTLAPPDPLERAHGLRLCTGNGLRPDVWETFRERFAIPRILEFYAATESTVSLYNVEGKVGAVGRVPGFMARRSPAALVRFDAATGLPMRGADGRCIRTAPGEPGELLGRLSEERGEQRFEGYRDAAETERKVLRDVMEPGDRWMRTGDLMRQDAQGFFYFVDRIGDTFRWKGENVATTEVAQALLETAGVREATVYGVEIPGADGRAGMAALTVGPEFDLAVLHEDLRRRLPAYARPLFLRFSAGLGVTDTFKHKKTALAAEGFDPSTVADPLFLDTGAAYVRLDADAHEAFLAGGGRGPAEPRR